MYNKDLRKYKEMLVIIHTTTSKMYFSTHRLIVQ